MIETPIPILSLSGHIDRAGLEALYAFAMDAPARAHEQAESYAAGGADRDPYCYQLGVLLAAFDQLVGVARYTVPAVVVP